MRNDVRRLTDGAMMMAIVGVILMINRQTGGLFDGMFIFAYPLPMLFYAAKYGLRDSLVTFAGIVLLSFILSTPQMMFYVASESLIGLVYGQGVRRKSDRHRLVIITCVMAVVINVVDTLVLAKVFGYDLAAEAAEYSRILTDALVKTGQTMDAGVDTAQLFLNVLMTSVVLTGALQAVVTHFLAVIMLRRLHIDMAPSVSVAQYYPPKWSGYLGIAGFFMYIYALRNTVVSETVQNVMQSVGMAGVVYLCIYGMIAIMVFLAVRNGGRGKAIYGIAALLLLMIAVMPVAMLGFLYITTEFHKRMLGDHYAAKTQ
ncbi:MAG: YybS family protein [Solobacterium sp.]|nr:YybS family protein [Solobacterium sp.]